MKIYTRTGDDGTTGLLGGLRVRKHAPRIEAYGSVDELNAAIGLARSGWSGESGDGATVELDRKLARIQGELFVLGAELATAPGTAAPAHMELISPGQIAVLEAEIDAWEAELEPLRSFILPGGNPAAAALHVARTVCRRAERAVLALLEQEPIRAEVVAYLNRLSDHLFVFARVANHRRGIRDVPWNPRA